MGQALQVAPFYRLLQQQEPPTETPDTVSKGEAFLIREPLIAVANKCHVGKGVVHGLHTTDIRVYILADLHFEEAKALLVPVTCKSQGVIDRRDRNRNTGFPRAYGSSAP